ncbi:MAG: phosphopantothenoylcysteine decarboxylase / phosphopantothenate---cysteine ligase [Solirubrobacteraceae bacterium]|nr:phosphopantothenoylcysteine decarboxylase / phosphopantothenate---cysteine ligase [Solirubrobacteraceae bacterium]
MARLLLGVTGGIAAYKALELVRLAVKAGHAVRVIQTPTSQRFVGAASFAALTGAPVLVSEFDRDPARGAFPDQTPPDHDPPSHLELVANADVFLIAPASANTIAKLAHGLADNLLTSAALAARCPVAVAPAMNDAMYEHPATRANLELLRERGVTVIEPDTGALGAQGEWGVGRLREPPDLLAAFEALVPAGAGEARGRWSGLRVLVTAGGTREPIDSVRYIGNRSSGRMGFALADEAARRGADVTVVAANVGLARNPVVSYVDVETAAELEEACRTRFAHTDVLLMAAAVADYRPTEPADAKIKKEDAASLALELERTNDVLAALAERRRPGQTLVGFAAEYGGEVDAARGKLERKGLDAVVLNDISRRDIGFDSAQNEVTIVSAAGATPVTRASKADVAAAVLDEVDRLRADAVHRA